MILKGRLRLRRNLREITNMADLKTFTPHMLSDDEDISDDENKKDEDVYSDEGEPMTKDDKELKEEDLEEEIE